MKISYELDLRTFKAWSGAVSTLDKIQREGKCEELEAILEDLYPEGMSETELNDLLWFEDEDVFEWLGIRTETAIKQDLEEKQDELSELLDDFYDEAEELDEEEKAELWKSNYKDDVASLEEWIEELEEELQNY